jgi:hypothetical protein
MIYDQFEILVINCIIYHMIDDKIDDKIYCIIYDQCEILMINGKINDKIYCKIDEKIYCATEL